MLRSGDVAAVTNMTFPSFRSLLAPCLAGEAHNGCAVIALVARDGDIPVGLVLAQVPMAAATDERGAERQKTAELLSVFVVSAWRRCGVATRLMLALEEALIQRACIRLATCHTTRLASWQPFERLLSATRWPAPETTLLMTTGYYHEMAKAPWLATSYETRPGFELFEWSQLSTGERAQLQRDVDGGKIPDGLSPFGDDETIEPTISVGVRHNGEVVAWLIVIRSPFVPNALCYRSLFVRSHLRTVQALGPLMMAAAFHRHATSTIAEERPVLVFGISFKRSTKMINFFRKRLASFCFSTYETRVSMKTLT